MCQLFFRKVQELKGGDLFSLRHEWSRRIRLLAWLEAFCYPEPLYNDVVHVILKWLKLSRKKMIIFFRPLDYDIPKDRYHFCVSSSSACPCVHSRLWIDKFATQICYYSFTFTWTQSVQGQNTVWLLSEE